MRNEYGSIQPKNRTSQKIDEKHLIPSPIFFHNTEANMINTVYKTE